MNKVSFLALAAGIMPLAIVCMDGQVEASKFPAGFIPAQIITIGGAVILLDAKKAQELRAVEKNYTETKRRRAQQRDGQKMPLGKPVAPPDRLVEVVETVRAIKDI